MTDSETEMRLDDLARRAGVATTTVRLYQNKGLLSGPRLAGRVGFYDAGHLARLRLIARLQDQGFSLAGIAKVLSTWESGRDLDDLVGIERELDTLLNDSTNVEMSLDELIAHFPEGALTAELVQRAAALGLVEPAPDGRVRVRDRRFLDTGAALLRLGVPASVVLDEWAQLIQFTDQIAGRFVAVFEQHVLPDDWRSAAGAEVEQLRSALRDLRQIARQVLIAGLDDSMSREGARRLGELAAQP